MLLCYVIQTLSCFVTLFLLLKPVIVESTVEELYSHHNQGCSEQYVVDIGPWSFLYC